MRNVEAELSNQNTFYTSYHLANMLFNIQTENWQPHTCVLHLNESNYCSTHFVLWLEYNRAAVTYSMCCAVTTTAYQTYICTCLQLWASASHIGSRMYWGRRSRLHAVNWLAIRKKRDKERLKMQDYTYTYVEVYCSNSLIRICSITKRFEI